MAALDTTSFAAALKEHYNAQTIENLVYKNNPFFAMVSKYEKFGGKNYPLPVMQTNPMGRSATFSTAQTNKTAGVYKEFLLTRVSDYALASISNEAIEASEGNANAFMEAATIEVDGAFQAATRSLSVAMYRNGSGSIGQCVGTSSPITLVNTNDITNFEVGMVITANDTDDTTSPRSGSHTVTGVDRDAGTYTFTGTITSLTASDYLFVQGDEGKKLSGLAAWLPFTAPGATAFFGVDRSSDTTRLAGIRQDGSTKPIEEALIDGAARIAREGGAPDACFMNFASYANLEKALGSKVHYISEKVGNIAFAGLMIQGPTGPIKVIPDQNCPSTLCYMLQMDSWKLYSLGKAPKILDADGNKMLRESSADAVEIRVGYYAQLGCSRPGSNGVIKLA